MNNHSIKNLFNPKSIAIVGASDKPGKVGTVIAQNVMNLGYSGEVYFVNQSYETLYEKKCWASLADIKESVDVAIIAVPAKFVLDVVKSGKDRIKNFVVISAGFAEVNAEGKRREQELAHLAEEHDLTILGPNCLGFIAPQLKLNASFAGGMPHAGNIAFISQSGALAVSFMDIARKKQLGFSSVISVGNKMQINESMLLEYFEKDPHTKVIAMYLEGILGGQEFIKVAKRVSKKKPIVVLKAGKSAKAQQAIASHTGALAGSDAIATKAFGEAGIIQAQNLEEFFDVVTLTSLVDAPKNNQVVVVTNAGGAGVLVTDAFEQKEIALADLTQQQTSLLAQYLPEEASLHNPIDILGDAQEDRYQNIISQLQKHVDAATILVLLTPQDQTPVDAIAHVVIEANKKSTKTILTSFIGGERVANAVNQLQSSGVPHFDYPQRAVQALHAYVSWNQRAQQKLVTHSEKMNVKRAQEMGAIIDHARAEGRKALYYSEAYTIMHRYGIPAAKAATILPKQQPPKELSYPVVLKVDSDKVLHKSDKQALVVNIANAEELDGAVKKMRKDFPDFRYIVQTMEDKQMEIILGIKRDENFGNVIVYGLGGIYTEIFKRVNFLIPPVSQEEIILDLQSGPLSFLFEKTRGQRPYQVKEFAKIIAALMSLAGELGQIKELDINPLFIYNDGRGASAVDVKVIF